MSQLFSGKDTDSPDSPDSAGPRCALKIIALRAKIGSVGFAIELMFALAR